jgi:hypothetical protein
MGMPSFRSVVPVVILAAASLTTAGAVAQSPPAASTAWAGPRLSDGQPDVQGSWRPAIAGGRSLEDPGAPGGIVEELNRAKGLSKKNPSRVIDPPDGKVPYQPWALALRQHQMENEIRATRPDHIDTQARCFILGAIRQAANVNQIVQSPGYVILINEAYHNFRVIPVDGRPHLSEQIKLWGGDSRGRWEGNTLIVDITNLNGKNRLSHDGDFMSEGAHIVERFTFVDREHLNYEATIDDPKVFTRPWKVGIPTVRARQRAAAEELWESACHEGERSAELMLSGGQKEQESK